MEHLTDAELIEAYLGGQRGALDFLIQRYLGMIYRFLRRFVPDMQTAEDLTQETFLKAWKNLGKFKKEKSFKTWLFTIAKNTAIDHLRKKSPLEVSRFEQEDGQEDLIDRIEDPLPLIDEVLERKELALELAQALAQVPPQARTVILLHETEDMTFQEVAVMMGRPLNTVKSWYRRALLDLRKILQQQKK